jgi:TonB family protein
MNYTMLKTLFLYTLCIITNNVFAQNKKPATRPDSVGYYMRDDKNMAYSEASANFVRLIIKTDSNMFRVNDYYMDGTPRLVVKTTVDSLDVFKGARGICYEYHPNGKRKSIKNYVNGTPIGDVVTYYPNGGLHSIETYSPQGIYLKQYLDSTGNVLADNGSGKWIKTSKQNYDGYMEGLIVNGKEDGEWKRHLKDTVYTIVYKAGKVVSGNEFLNVTKEIYTRVEQVPTFPGGDAGFNKYIAKNIKYPGMARDNNVQGRVIVQFVVEKDGTLTDVKVVRGIGSGCDQEAVRVISQSPKWKPGLVDSKPVRVTYSVPISFSLQRETFPQQQPEPSYRNKQGGYN